MKKIYLISLGCARNLVDSEMMSSRITASGGVMCDNPDEADVILINTCGFIEAAADESIQTILDMARYKTDGNCRLLIVAGCLPERFGTEIASELPEVDLFIGTGALEKIGHILKAPRQYGSCLLPDPNSAGFQKVGATRTLTPPHMSYLKIAEGCSKHCTYCIIPKLRGRHRSRPFHDIVSEARRLVAGGVKELVLVAQDTTAYGQDVPTAGGLDSLLEALSDLSDRLWIRFMYGYPENINPAIIRTVADHANICPYFDIPIQHASDCVLKRMGRPGTEDDLYRLFDSIRAVVPDAAFRTTVIVGFPGETDADFSRLLKFIERVRFDQLGGFLYSDFDDLPSHRLPDHVPPAVAKERYDALMAVQQAVSLSINTGHVGRRADVLIEEKVEPGLYVGRTRFQAPEVDGMTYVRGRNLVVGDFAGIKITDAFEYDLSGDAQ